MNSFPEKTNARNTVSTWTALAFTVIMVITAGVLSVLTAQMRTNRETGTLNKELSVETEANQDTSPKIMTIGTLSAEKARILNIAENTVASVSAGPGVIIQRNLAGNAWTVQVPQIEQFSESGSVDPGNIVIADPGSADLSSSHYKIARYKGVVSLACNFRFENVLTGTSNSIQVSTNLMSLFPGWSIDPDSVTVLTNANQIETRVTTLATISTASSFVHPHVITTIYFGGPTEAPNDPTLALTLLLKFTVK
jgi:hypothetical protein